MATVDNQSTGQTTTMKMVRRGGGVRGGCVLLAVLAAACAKSPEGQYVKGGEAVRIFREGEASFVEFTTLGAIGSKPAVAKLDKGDSGWRAQLGLMGEMSLTLTDEGLAVTTRGQKFNFKRVHEATAIPLEPDAAAGVLTESLAGLSANMQETKKCGWETLPATRLSTTAALVNRAKLTVTSSTHGARRPVARYLRGAGDPHASGAGGTRAQCAYLRELRRLASAGASARGG